LNFEPVFKQDQRRDAVNPKANGRIPVFLDIECAHKGLAFKLPGKIFDDRFLKAAGSAPGCVKVDQYHSIGYDVLKVVFRC
jgi:hypothetical protein